jgi:hypothetical protein
VCGVCDAAHIGTRVRWPHSHRIQTAPGPMKLFEGARYSVGFAVEVGSDKYDEHMPLERQVQSICRMCRRVFDRRRHHTRVDGAYV